MLSTILMAITLVFVLMLTLVVGTLWSTAKNLSVVTLHIVAHLSKHDKDFYNIQPTGKEV